MRDGRPLRPIDIDTGEVPAQIDDPPVATHDEPGTLQGMAKDGFVFFTPALITTHGFFDRDPVVEFNRTHSTNDESVRPFTIDCQYPFFQDIGKGILGCEVIDWDHRLYGVIDETWEPLKSFISSIAWSDPARYNLTRVATHPLVITDPTTLYNSSRVLAEIPTIEITVFAVSSYRSFIWMAEAQDPPRTRPYPMVTAPSPEMRAAAEAVLGPPLSPEKLGEFKP